jgi:hypothetical protein
MKATNRIRLRGWKQLCFRDPRTDLVELAKLQAQMDKGGTSPVTDDLRVRELRKFLEYRQAALFAYFVGHSVLKTLVAYAVSEAEDYDSVLWWKVADRNHYLAVQLKEVVPEHLNPTADINSELAKLQKYVTSKETVVAVHVNRSGMIDFSGIRKPVACCAEIWLYGTLSADQSVWFLYGDLLNAPHGHEIRYPT